MINKKTIKLILKKGLKAGADFSEIYIENSLNHSIKLENNIIENITFNNLYGAGLRLLKNNFSVYGYTNKINKKNLLKLIDKLSIYLKKCNDKSIRKKIINNITNINENRNNLKENFNNSYFNTPIVEKINILKSANKIIRNHSNLIKQVTCVLNGTKKNIEIYNSEGLNCQKQQEYIQLFLKATAIEKNKHETMSQSFGIQGNMQCFLKKININEIAGEVATNVVNVLKKALPCPSGKMTIIIGNGFGGVLFHESCGHALEASSVSLNLSVFANKLNKQIASNLVTAYDDGTIPNAFGSNSFDDEGEKTNKTCLIKKGKLVNYLIDNFNGRRMNHKGNGACRRQNYQFEPTSRMSNTFIDNGKSTVQEIIKNTKFGLYAKKLGGGSVNPITGEFEFAVDIGYIVRNGIISEQVKGATLIGKCEEVLKKIDMVGNDLKREQGFCGASSGDIPVEVGQPTIRIKEMLVGGQIKKK